MEPVEPEAVRRWLAEVEERLRRGEVEEAMATRLHRPDPRQQLRRLWFSEGAKETAAIAALSFGEYLYDVAHIDPTVLEGIDFARSLDLSNLSVFAWFASEYHGLSEASQAGHLAQLSGYVGERFVALELREQGHHVAFPDDPNEAGYDLLVDGQPFQVKVVQSARHVHEHLERYPDIPVLVNAELADEVGHLDGVYVTSVTHAAVREATETALDQGVELLDFEIPWISGIVAGVREGQRLLRGEIDLFTAGSKVAAIVAGRAGGAWAGQLVGPVVGSFFFGPAGFLVFSGLGALAGSHVGRDVALGGLARWRSRNVVEAGMNLARAAAGHIPEKMTLHRERAREVASRLERDGRPDGRGAGGSVEDSDVRAADSDVNAAVAQYLSRRADEEIGYLSSLQMQLSDAAESRWWQGGSLQQRVEHVLRLIRRAAVHPVRLQQPLKRLGDSLKSLW